MIHPMDTTYGRGLAAYRMPLDSGRYPPGVLSPAERYEERVRADERAKVLAEREGRVCGALCWDVEEDRDRLVAELATMREVAQGNKRHVAYLTEENERLRAEVARVRAEVAEELVDLKTRVFDAESALAELVRLKDGPRDEAYERARPLAWSRARAVLAQIPDAPVESAVGAPTPAVVASDLDGACHSVWLHGKWRWLTSQMTTEEREAFADAVDRAGDALADGEPRLPVDRWWREPVRALPEGEGTRQEELINGD